ncbi:hypothetical protein E4U42_006597 [Claviceps africana]|uniref:Uncharacterized protein n=1 Tax=Claviceps africana TaxID=83212 RepID=A0A8K0J255_9HYPO|nr:hypothetical protein E4U42_006597 [Claviceps africana]
MKLQLYTSTLLAAACAAVPFNLRIGGGTTTTFADDPKKHIPEVNHLLWEISLEDFIAHKTARDPYYLDWTSDGCTYVIDNPLHFHYTPACNRHDFAYQNFRLEGRFNIPNKDSIDSKFEDDLMYVCDQQHGIKRRVCKALARIYWVAVSTFGGPDASENPNQKPGRRSIESKAPRVKELNATFEALLTEYENGVREGQALGHLPPLPEGVRAGLEPLRLKIAALAEQE